MWYVIGQNCCMACSRLVVLESGLESLFAGLGLEINDLNLDLVLAGSLQGTFFASLFRCT